jgi:hypothetical protein
MLQCYLVKAVCYHAKMTKVVVICAISCGAVASLSASTVVRMMEQLHKGGRTKRVWSQYFINWSKGGPSPSYDVKHQTLHSAVLSQVIIGVKYCQELMSTMKFELGRVSEVKVSQASSIGTRLWRFTLLANVLVFK